MLRAHLLQLGLAVNNAMLLSRIEARTASLFRLTVRLPLGPLTRRLLPR